MAYLDGLTPVEVGLPARFTRWRTVQHECVDHIENATTRFVVPQIPTGGGKSLSAMTAALLFDKRVAVLTSRRGLQDQYISDFGPCGLVDVRGRQNYDCVVFQGDCEEGRLQHCDEHLKAYRQDHVKGVPSVCSYIRARQRAAESQLVTTNYTYWCLTRAFSKQWPLGNFDMLVLDEAHDAPDEVCRVMSTKIGDVELRSLIRDVPPDHTDIDSWAEFATEVYPRIKQDADAEELRLKNLTDVPAHVAKRSVQLSKLARKLDQLRLANSDNWVVARVQYGYEFTPVSAAPFAERVLFAGIPKIVLMSATVTPKTMQLLGVKKSDYDFRSYPYQFDTKKSRIMYVGGARATAKELKANSATYRKFLRQIDNIVRARRDRKGLLQTTSYWLAKALAADLEAQDLIICPEPAALRDAVEQFKRSLRPALLISPAITTGFDFPYYEAEYNIIAKVPFPPGNDPVVKQRDERDPEYSKYLIVQALAQACGRINRAIDDQGEVFIIDEHWSWFRNSAKHLMPKYFRQLTNGPKVSLPTPPPSLLAKQPGYEPVV